MSDKTFTIPQSIMSEMNSFMFQELFYAHRKAVEHHANNKFNEYSYEGMLATYRFKWTDRNNMHLIDVIKKGER